MRYYTVNNQNNSTTDLYTIPWEAFFSDNNVNIAWEPLPVKPVEDGEKERDLKERTFVMIKPDAFERGLVGEVLDLVSQRGLKLIACKTVQMTKQDCEQHYSHHVGKDFYPSLVQFMTSGPSLAMLFEGENACGLIRQLIGDSKHPSQVQPGSIRGRYAMDFPRNLIHGSKTYDEASHEHRLYLTPGDIFDEHRIQNIQAEFAEKKAMVLAALRRKIKRGINLGDEIFAPDLLREGDWVAHSMGVSLIKRVELSQEHLVIEREDYMGSWWKQCHQQAFFPESYESSADFTWAGSNLFLVGREGIFLDKFVSVPIADREGCKYVFKNGRFLPIFKRKSKTDPLPSKIPFASIYEDDNGISISDIYDPVNQVVMKVASKDDPVKWRILIGDGQELVHKSHELQKCTMAGARSRLKVWGKSLNPGGMSVLLRYGLPFAATYGNMELYDLKGGL